MNQGPEKEICKIIDKAGALIFYCNAQGKILMCNKEFEKIMGLPRQSIVEAHYLKVIYGRAASVAGNSHVFSAMVEDVLKYRRPANFEGVISDSAGNEHFISWNITPIIDNDPPLEGVFFLGNDMTAFKERDDLFRNIEGTLKGVLSSIKEYALYVTNLAGKITYYGMGAEPMFGWDRKEIIFKDIDSLHLYDEVAYKLPFILEEVKKHGRYEMETYLIKKDGHSLPVSLTVNPFLDKQGNITGYIFMAKDITERKRLEYEIFQSEKLAAVGQLVAGIAHEINNPVFVISGRTGMMLSDKKCSKALKDNLKVIDKQAERIRKLVNRFLAFTRKSTPNMQEVNVNTIIKDSLPLLDYHRLPSCSIKIIKKFSKDMLKIKGDYHQLQEVFINLFINAYQAMPYGGTLSIKTENLSDEFAFISISDTGTGINQETLKNLFMPFFSTKKEGTGLGLSICYNIIRNHSGVIEVDTQVNKGTTFIIKIPFCKSGGKL